MVIGTSVGGQQLCGAATLVAMVTLVTLQLLHPLTQPCVLCFTFLELGRQDCHLVLQAEDHAVLL